VASSLRWHRPVWRVSLSLKGVYIASRLLAPPWLPSYFQFHCRRRCPYFCCHFSAATSGLFRAGFALPCRCTAVVVAVAFRKRFVRQKLKPKGGCGTTFRGARWRWAVGRGASAGGAVVRRWPAGHRLRFGRGVGRRLGRSCCIPAPSHRCLLLLFFIFACWLGPMACLGRHFYFLGAANKEGGSRFGPQGTRTHVCFKHVGPQLNVPSPITP